jgi:hypothetical protein
MLTCADVSRRISRELRSYYFRERCVGSIQRSTQRGGKEREDMKEGESRRLTLMGREREGERKCTRTREGQEEV